MSTIIHKLRAATFEKSADDRTFTVTLSTPRQDRDLDTIPVENWVVPDPIPLCWAHDTQQFPLGRVRNVRILPGVALRGVVEFPPAGTYDVADTALRLVQTGFLSSVSVGFRVIDKPVPNGSGGVDFVGQKELLELSVVNVPSNVDARIDASASAAMQKWLRGDAAGDDEIVLQLVDEPTAARKRGRVLSQANEQRVRSAQAACKEADEHLARVLASLPTDAPPDDELADDGKVLMISPDFAAELRAARRRSAGDPLGDPAAAHHHVGGEPTINIADVMAVLPAAFAETMAALVREETERALRLARGRVD